MESGKGRDMIDNEEGESCLSSSDNIRIELNSEMVGNSTTSIKSNQVLNGFYNL